MSSDLNVVVLAGRLTRDPEPKQSASGKSWCRVSVACNRWVPAKDGGAGREEVIFVDVVAFGKLAEALPSFAGKGSAVVVRGHLTVSNREDRHELGIVADDITAYDRPPQRRSPTHVREPAAIEAEFLGPRPRSAPFGGQIQ